LLRIVLVDIDPAMANLARTHPTLLAINKGSTLDPRVELTHAVPYQLILIPPNPRNSRIC
jgi:predicted membrane-bound spermidine synthase